MRDLWLNTSTPVHRLVGIEVGVQVDKTSETMAAV
jgi:hypothetical protein